MDLEIKSIAQLAGSDTAFATAIKAGPWIFLTGHEAFDFETGGTDAVAGPPGFPLYGQSRYRREGEYILRRMQSLLGEFGSDLSHGVRLDQYYPTPAAVEPYHHARRANFGAYIPPSTSIVMERCFSGDTGISTSLIAVVPDEAYKIERVYPKDVLAPPWSGFVPAITCNEFVFIAGQMATNAQESLDARAHVADHARWGGSEIRKQTTFLIEEKLKPALESAGSSLAGALKAQVYIEGVHNFPDFHDVWSTAFADIPCALTVVPAKSYGTVGGIIEINLLALKSDATRTKQVVTSDFPEMASYGPCIRAGEFLFPSALMAITPEGAIPASPALDGLSHKGFVQASLIYRYLESLCAAAGTTMDNVLRAQYFVSDVAEFAGISAAWRARYSSRPHPFVCVGVPTPLPAPGSCMVADVWIYIPNR